MSLSDSRIEPPQRTTIHKVTAMKRLLPLTGFLFLAAAGTVAAQTPVTAPDTPAPARAGRGFIDFGARGTTSDGDAARYERYRDMSDGIFLETATFVRDWRTSLFDFRAEHVGRKDQRYTGSFIHPGRVKAWMTWDQIPMNMSTTTKTLFTSQTASFLAIADPLQAQVQTVPASINSVFAANSQIFDLRSRRHIFATGVEYLATPDLAFKGQVRRMMREGAIPYGGSFGHSSLVEMPAPVLHTTNDVEGSAEYTTGPLLLRGGYNGSWFTNEVTQLEFDSPFRLTDIASTPSHGRLSQAPGNSFISANGLASVTFAGRSRATAYFSVGMLKDAGAPIMPQSINTAFVTSPLERTAVEGEARTTSMNLTFVSRPTRMLEFSARYKTYDYDNRTPEFDLTQRVAYDASPAVATMGSLGGTSSSQVNTEPFGVVRHNFDGEAGLNMDHGLRAAIGYIRLEEDRNHRVIEGTTDNILKISFDVVGNTLFSVRSRYEHGQRRGEATEEAERELFRIGEQPGIRHFDVAERNRDRVTVVGGVTPLSTVSFSASLGVGKDDYIDSVFGLRDNTHRVYTIGGDYIPTDRVSFNAGYSFERYQALSRSRQANPPAANAQITFEQYQVLNTQANPGVQVADASRNWASDGLDRAHGVMVGLEIMRIAEKVDFRLNYDYSNAHADYTYIAGAVPDRTLPEEVIVDSTLPPPNQLPPTRSVLHRSTMDLTYSLTSRLGIGFSAWHESYSVSDFTLDEEATPNLARAGIVILGYTYRPYNATTLWGRLFYSW
jgi:MtrB/PioB family decaheme-associated outer membrane protein